MAKRVRKIARRIAKKGPRAELARASRALHERVLGPPLSALRPANVTMFHIGRSGSRVLGDLLGQHRRVYWDGEVFEPKHKKWRRSEDPLPILKQRMSRAGRRLYGLELKFFHTRLMGLEFKDFLAELELLGFDRFIVLRRKNSLRKIVSSVLLHQGRKHIRTDRKADLRQVRLDLDDVRIDRDAKPLLAYLEDYDRRFEDLERLLEGRNVLHLSYEEDVFNDPTLAYRRTCAYLGLEPDSVAVKYRKTNPYPLADIVTNFDELQRTLAGTRFEWMVDE